MSHKPYAESCEQNRQPIGQILQRYVENRQSLLEIGSGTGQHAVYFAAQYPWLNWQTSDLAEYHPGIQAWIDDSGLGNVLAPIELDVSGDWPGQEYDLIFSANTLHIMSASEVEQLFRHCPACMQTDAALLIYGPFNYANQYTSDSNARFDQWLKQRDLASGIKNFEWLQDIASNSGLECVADYPMPANNRILVWQKNSP